MAQFWYFAYGPTMDESKLKEKGIKIIDSKSATLQHYSLFSSSNDNSFILDSNIIEDTNNNVQGVAYLIDEKYLNKINILEKYPKVKEKRNVEINFRNDSNDMPSKKAIVFLKKETFSPTNFFKLGQGMMKIKSENKIMKFNPQGSNFTNMVTFESFKDNFRNNINENMIYLYSYEDFINKEKN